MWHKDAEPLRGESAFKQGGPALPNRDVQHAWYELTRVRPWTSVALVPVEDSGATLPLGHDMARMAALDPRHRTLLINATGSVDLAAVMPPATPGEAPTPVALGKYWYLDCARLGLDDAAVGMVEVPRFVDAMRASPGTGPFNRILVVTAAPLQRPAAVSAARSVDAVALCVPLVRSDFASTQRTLELIGAERVVGAIALRERA